MSKKKELKKLEQMLKRKDGEIYNLRKDVEERRPKKRKLEKYFIKKR